MYTALPKVNKRDSGPKFGAVHFKVPHVPAESCQIVAHAIRKRLGRDAEEVLTILGLDAEALQSGLAEEGITR